MDLTPVELGKLLASLEVSKALVIDLIRGRSVYPADVTLIRNSAKAVRAVLDALDDARPWDIT